VASETEVALALGERPKAAGQLAVNIKERAQEKKFLNQKLASAQQEIDLDVLKSSSCRVLFSEVEHQESDEEGVISEVSDHDSKERNANVEEVDEEQVKDQVIEDKGVSSSSVPESNVAEAAAANFFKLQSAGNFTSCSIIFHKFGISVPKYGDFSMLWFAETF
jgi:hypothetical protein